VANLDEPDSPPFGRLGRYMTDRQARGAPREAPVGDQCAGSAQPLRFQIARGVKHFLHPGTALWPFVTNDDNVARLDLSGQNPGDRRILAFIDLRRTGELEDRIIDPRGLHDAAVARNVTR